MSRQAGNKPRFRRWRYIIDWKTQLGSTSKILLVVTVLCSLYAAGTFFLTRDVPLFEMGPDQFRAFLIKIYAVYLLVSSAIFAVLAISLTHRFVGPAFVVERALKGIQKGDYTPRVKLRKGDHLQGLATTAQELRDFLQDREQQQQQVVEDLARCIEENDLEAAKELLTRLRAEPVQSPEPVAEEAATA